MQAMRRGLIVGSVLLQTLAVSAQTPRPIQAWLASEDALPVATFRVIPSSIAGPSANETRGAVEVEVVVDASGRVAHARVVTSLAEAFDQASLEAVRRWRFRPAMRSNKPITTLVGVRFMFLPPRTAGGNPEVNALVGVLPRRPLPDPAAPLDAYPIKGTPGLVPLRAIRTVTPEYTPAAMKRKIQGDVELEIVVRADGSVGSARVLRSLDASLGLDEQALIGARYWFFEPATLNGQAVAATARLVLSFRLY